MNKLFVANWKMELTHNESISWIATHLPQIESALALSKNKLVLCPSFSVLGQIGGLRTAYSSWGSQDCGFEERGAYTGDTSAHSLKELNCSYGIVGHSERRLYYNESDELVSQKAAQLSLHSIEPIVCIGETALERKQKNTLAVLERQLAPIITRLAHSKLARVTLAYEPVWAIGTGETPTATELIETLSWISEHLCTKMSTTTITLLYGGSVNPTTLTHLKEVPVDGFLLGKASIDSEILKKIILSW